jgi:hypothetical protein
MRQPLAHSSTCELATAIAAVHVAFPLTASRSKKKPSALPSMSPETTSTPVVRPGSGPCGLAHAGRAGEGPAVRLVRGGPRAHLVVHVVRGEQVRAARERLGPVLLPETAGEPAVVEPPDEPRRAYVLRARAVAPVHVEEDDVARPRVRGESTRVVDARDDEAGARVGLRAAADVAVQHAAARARASAREEERELPAHRHKLGPRARAGHRLAERPRGRAGGSQVRGPKEGGLRELRADRRVEIVGALPGAKIVLQVNEHGHELVLGDEVVERAELAQTVGELVAGRTA